MRHIDLKAGQAALIKGIIPGLGYVVWGITPIKINHVHGHLEGVPQPRLGGGGFLNVIYPSFFC